MRKAIVVASAAVLMVAGASATVLGDPVTECAKIEGKALVGFFGALFKESGRACGQGSAMAPQAISQAAVGSMMGKLLSAVGKGVDKNGASSCLITLENLNSPGINIEPEQVVNTVRNLANQACLVP